MHTPVPHRWFVCPSNFQGASPVKVAGVAAPQPQNCRQRAEQFPSEPKRRADEFSQGATLKNVPTPAVRAMANAPQKVTRTADLSTPDPPT